MLSKSILFYSVLYLSHFVSLEKVMMLQVLIIFYEFAVHYQICVVQLYPLNLCAIQFMLHYFIDTMEFNIHILHGFLLEIVVINDYPGCTICLFGVDFSCRQIM